MFPPFPQKEALIYCRALARQVQQKNLFCAGAMIGVCLCKSVQGEQIVLKAFSGQYEGNWLLDGWVSPCFDVSAYDLQVHLYDGRIHELGNSLADTSVQSEKRLELKKERRMLSRTSLEQLANLYRFYCADGQIRGFGDILPSFPHVLPPTGCGDCCAPKLLSEAFRRKLLPLSLAEIYVGRPPRSGSRITGRTYPPCDEKCRLVLPAILGLEIVYRDKYLIVVNKPSGLLSVPGRTAEMQDCVVNRVKRLFPACMEQPAVHRLDMDTSGLLVLAFTPDVHRALSIQFQNGLVDKEYIALLDGTVKKELRMNGRGTIELPFRLDPENRPHQIYDPVHGKKGITKWEIIREELVRSGADAGRRRTRIRFIPCTGRTHQLRVHSAHPLGLGVPIVGDRLYGNGGGRLMLHARSLSFIHPISGGRLCLTSSVPF